METKSPYADIMDMAHPVSARHPGMDLIDRAAQFAPFAALTGYDGVIQEAARLTDGALDLTEEAVAAIDRQLQSLLGEIHRQPRVTAVFFEPDSRKPGGRYVTYTGALKKIDADFGYLQFTDGKTVPLEALCAIS